MEFLIKFDTVKSGWSIVYIEVSQVKFLKKNLSLKIDFALANSADPDEMLHNVAMRYFIWVSTVCQSTCFGLSGHQRVK